jgi:hypothetical protein
MVLQATLYRLALASTLQRCGGWQRRGRQGLEGKPYIQYRYTRAYVKHLEKGGLV